MTGRGVDLAVSSWLWECKKCKKWVASTKKKIWLEHDDFLRFFVPGTTTQAPLLFVYQACWVRKVMCSTHQSCQKRAQQLHRLARMRVAASRVFVEKKAGRLEPLLIHSFRLSWVPNLLWMACWQHLRWRSIGSSWKWRDTSSLVWDRH